jgi:hypothetical protein
MTKAFDHSPGGVTCTGISLPIAHYGSLPRESVAKSETFEACIGAAIEEGIQVSRASTGKVMCHRDESGRTSMDGLMYVSGCGTDTRNTVPDAVTARLQTAFLEAYVFFRDEAPVDKAKKLSRVYTNAVEQWDHAQRLLKRLTLEAASPCTHRESPVGT